MLSGLDDRWALLLSIAYVVVAQGLSGIAKDLTKMSSKSAIKLVVPEDAHGALFKWVALLTGSKNALNGQRRRAAGRDVAVGTDVPVRRIDGMPADGVRHGGAELADRASPAQRIRRRRRRSARGPIVRRNSGAAQRPSPPVLSRRLLPVSNSPAPGS